MPTTAQGHSGDRDLKKTLKGQSLSEYLLLATLIAIVSIGGLSVLANTAANSLPNLLECIFDGACENKTNNNGNSPSPTGTAIEVSGGAGQGTHLPRPAPNTSHVSFTLSNGSQITLTNYPTDLSCMIETAGGNGTTETLLANLEELITALVEAGEIDATQAGTLSDLANQGHLIAEYQGAIEAFDANNSAWTGGDYTINQTAITVSGYGRDLALTSTNVATATTTIGFSEDGNFFSPNIQEFLNQANYDSSLKQWTLAESSGADIKAGSALSKFITLYKEAENSGALNNPTTSQIV